MHQTSFLQDLAIVMSVAALATVLFRQLKQPVVLGYILAGVDHRPAHPALPLIADEHTIETLAELGHHFSDVLRSGWNSVCASCERWARRRSLRPRSRSC